MCSEESTDTLPPEPPKLLRNLRWLQIYGRHHKGIVALAIVVILFLVVLKLIPPDSFRELLSRSESDELTQTDAEPSPSDLEIGILTILAEPNEGQLYSDTVLALRLHIHPDQVAVVANGAVGQQVGEPKHEFALAVLARVTAVAVVLLREYAHVCHVRNDVLGDALRLAAQVGLGNEDDARIAVAGHALERGNVCGDELACFTGVSGAIVFQAGNLRGLVVVKIETRTTNPFLEWTPMW